MGVACFASLATLVRLCSVPLILTFALSFTLVYLLLCSAGFSLCIHVCIWVCLRPFSHVRVSFLFTLLFWTAAPPRRPFSTHPLYLLLLVLQCHCICIIFFQIVVVVVFWLRLHCVYFRYFAPRTYLHSPNYYYYCNYCAIVTLYFSQHVPVLEKHAQLSNSPSFLKLHIHIIYQHMYLQYLLYLA